MRRIWASLAAAHPRAASSSPARRRFSSSRVFTRFLKESAGAPRRATTAVSGRAPLEASPAPPPLPPPLPTAPRPRPPQMPRPCPPRVRSRPSSPSAAAPALCVRSRLLYTPPRPPPRVPPELGGALGLSAEFGRRESLTGREVMSPPKEEVSAVRSGPSGLSGEGGIGESGPLGDPIPQASPPLPPSALSSPPSPPAQGGCGGRRGRR